MTNPDAPCPICAGSGYAKCCEVDIGVGIQTCSHPCECTFPKNPDAALVRAMADRVYAWSKRLERIHGLMSNEMLGEVSPLRSLADRMEGARDVAAWLRAAGDGEPYVMQAICEGLAKRWEAEHQGKEAGE